MQVEIIEAKETATDTNIDWDRVKYPVVMDYSSPGNGLRVIFTDANTSYCVAKGDSAWALGEKTRNKDITDSIWKFANSKDIPEKAPDALDYPKLMTDSSDGEVRLFLSETRSVTLVADDCGLVYIGYICDDAVVGIESFTDYPHALKLSNSKN